MAWPASIPTIGAGGFATSADFNDYRDALKAEGDPWTPYSPTLTAVTTDPTLGTSVVSGRFHATGHTADVDIDVVIGSGFSAGSGSYRLSLPSGVAPLVTTTAKPLGAASVFDVSANGTQVFTVLVVSSTTISMLANSVGTVNNSTIAWAVGDRISVHIARMEIA